PRTDATDGEPQPTPPPGKARQPRQAETPKRAPVVAADRVGNAILPKRALTVPPRGRGRRRATAVAPQQKPTGRIPQRQRIAQRPVPDAELAFEIDRPQRIRDERRRQGPAAWSRPAAPAAPRHQPVAAQPITHRRAPRPPRLPVARA